MVDTSADTRIDEVPLLRSGVRVVAQRIVGRATAGNEVERAFVATVDVLHRDLTEWTAQEIGGTGRQFAFDVVDAEDDALGATRVAIEFDTVACAPDLAAASAP